MTAPPKRRWFRFSLRTMFVVVTAFGVWLGWQFLIVQERKAILADAKNASDLAEGNASGERIFLYLRREEADYGFVYALIHYFDRDGVSAIRRLFGDEPCDLLRIPKSIAPPLIQRLERAFPESSIKAVGFLGDETFAYRDSLYKPAKLRQANVGTLFKTGLIEK